MITPKSLSNSQASFLHGSFAITSQKVLSMMDCSAIVVLPIHVNPGQLL